MTKLRIMLSNKGMTGRELAELAGVSESTVYKYMCASRILSPKVAKKFAAYLKCDPAELVDSDKSV